MSHTVKLEFVENFRFIDEWIGTPFSLRPSFSPSILEFAFLFVERLSHAIASMRRRNWIPTENKFVCVGGHFVFVTSYSVVFVSWFLFSFAFAFSFRISNTQQVYFLHPSDSAGGGGRREQNLTPFYGPFNFVDDTICAWMSAIRLIRWTNNSILLSSFSFTATVNQFSLLHEEWVKWRQADVRILRNQYSVDEPIHQYTLKVLARRVRCVCVRVHVK